MTTLYFDDSNEPISQNQLKYLFGLCKKYNVSNERFKQIAKEHGYFSRKRIKKKDFEKIAKAIENDVNDMYF